MKQIHRFKQVAFLSFVALIVLACGSGAAAATPPPLPSVPPTPVDTATPRPTSTARPTATNIPPTPTPASIGFPVVYDPLEITVLDVINRESVHFGDVTGGWETFYKPLPGKYLIDVGVLVRNLKPGDAVRMTWSNVYVVEANGDAWYPRMGEYENGQR